MNHKSFSTYRELSAAMPISFSAGVEVENRRQELMAKKARERKEREKLYWHKMRNREGETREIN